MPRPGTLTPISATETLTVHALVPANYTLRYRTRAGSVTRAMTPGAVLSGISGDEAEVLLSTQVRCTDGVTRCPVS